MGKTLALLLAVSMFFSLSSFSFAEEKKKALNVDPQNLAKVMRIYQENKALLNDPERLQALIRLSKGFKKVK